MSDAVVQKHDRNTAETNSHDDPVSFSRPTIEQQPRDAMADGSHRAPAVGEHTTALPVAEVR